jgi:hypothetical protein
MVGSHLQRDQTELVKLVKHIAGKHTVIANLESTQARGDIPPTLRIPVPLSMRGKDFESNPTLSHAVFLESIKVCEENVL